LSSLQLPPASRARSLAHVSGRAPLLPAAKPAILLVSDDTALGEKLRQAAEDAGRSVVAAYGLVPALRAVRSARHAAVLLDLDLPSHDAWRIADSLLQEAGCPPMILLTGRRDQFDLSTAIRAGTLMDKSTECSGLWAAVDRALALPDFNRGERNAIQRIMIQWLRPCAWSVPITPPSLFRRAEEQ